MKVVLLATVETVEIVQLHRCFVLTRGAQVPRVRALECSSETTFLTLRDVSPAKVRGTLRLTCHARSRVTRRPKCPD